MNPTQEENEKDGSLSWQLRKPPRIQTSTPDRPDRRSYTGDVDRNFNRCPMLEAYAWPLSVNVGEQVSFYVSTMSVSYSIQVFRLGWYKNGDGGRPVTGVIDGLKIGGATAPQPAPQWGSGDASTWAAGWSWRVPKTMVSGCYVAKLTASQFDNDSYAFFVVREDHRPSAILMQCSVTTYHAYNGWGGNSVYPYNNLHFDPLDETERQWRFGETIWLKRPYLPSNSPYGARGGGAGALFIQDKGPQAQFTWPAVVHCKSTATSCEDRTKDGFYWHYARQAANWNTCSGWEYNMIRWLEAEKYDVTYCTNIDTDRNQLARARHKLFMSVGHDEYWSLKAYRNVGAARDAGMNLMFASGNTVWNCVDLDTDGQMRVVGSFNRARSVLRSNPPLTASDYALVGGTWTFYGDSDFIVTTACPQWMLDGVGKTSGDILGSGLVGYEANGRDATHPEWERELPNGLQVILDNARTRAATGPAEAVVYVTSKGAIVVSLGTVQWSWGLDDFTVEEFSDGVDQGGSPRRKRSRADVQQFTRNIINRCIK